MSHFQAILRHPLFAPWFAAVVPVFWPVLYWQISRLADWMEKTGHTNLKVRVHWWGGLSIAYIGDKTPDPSAYRAYVPTCRAWDDPTLQSDLPETVEAPCLLILPCVSGGGGILRSRMTEGALPTPPNTS
jgi:hypothetical protein